MNLVKGLRFEKQVLQTEKGIQYFHDNLKKESAPQELGKVQIECRSSQKDEILQPPAAFTLILSSFDCGHTLQRQRDGSTT